jgi:hypothetical protein
VGEAGEDEGGDADLEVDGEAPGDADEVEEGEEDEGGVDVFFSASPLDDDGCSGREGEGSGIHGYERNGNGHVVQFCSHV